MFLTSEDTVEACLAPAALRGLRSAPRSCALQGTLRVVFMDGQRSEVMEAKLYSIFQSVLHTGKLEL